MIAAVIMRSAHALIHLIFPIKIISFLRLLCAIERRSILEKNGSTDHICHIVKSGRLSCKEFRSFHSALREDLAGISSVGEGDDLVTAREHNVVLTDDGAAAQRLDPDLLRVSRDTLGGTVIFIVVAVVKTLIDGIRKSNGCSARSIELAVVMLL